MIIGESNPAPSRRVLLAVGASLAALVYLAYFLHFTEFGFYGDDHAFFGGLINRGWREEVDNVWFCLTKWPQGRPLGMGLNLNLIPYILFHISGLNGLYGVACLIVAVNCTLFYRLVVQFQPPVVALSAAGFYALAPADTVQISLAYAYNFEIAVLFGLLATMAALRDRRLWFALALGASLLMVEPVAMFALLAPLFFTVRRERAWILWAVGHVAIWTGVVLAVLLARRIIGDPWGSERVSEIAAKPLAVFQSGLISAFTGFRTHLNLVLERVAQPLQEADAGIWLVMLGAGGIAGISMWLVRPQTNAREAGPTGGETAWWRGGRLLLAGCAIMLAIYFCYFRAPWYPANWRTGFMSGVHVIAATGSCLVFGGLVSLLSDALPRRLKPALVLLPILVFASLTGFGNLVQRDYAKSWAFQRDFWSAYVRLCPDATDGTFVLVLDRNLPAVRYTDLFSWGAEILPGALFDYRNTNLAENQKVFSENGVNEAPPARLLERPPSVIYTAPDPAWAIKLEGQKYTWKPDSYFMLPKTPAQQPEAGNVIVLTYDGQGIWKRISGEIAVDGGMLLLKPARGENLLHRIRQTPLAAVYGL